MCYHELNSVSVLSDFSTVNIFHAICSSIYYPYYPDYKSDSEIYTEPKVTGGEKSLDKIKKLHLDERYLTKREQRLRERKKSAKELLDWKKRLDEEEKHIFELEKKALKVWDHGEKDKKKREKEVEKVKPPTKREVKGMKLLINPKMRNWIC